MIDIKTFLEGEKVSEIRSYFNGEWLNIMIGTVRSKRHISGILKKIKVLKLVNKADIVGTIESEWIIFSIGQIDVHLLSQEKRQYYEIDQLWGNYEL